MSPMHIRAARESDLAVMQDIERAAGSWFREIGMPEMCWNWTCQRFGMDAWHLRAGNDLPSSPPGLVSA